MEQHMDVYMDKYVYLGPHRTPHGCRTWNTDYHHIFIYVYMYVYLGQHGTTHGLYICMYI